MARQGAARVFFDVVGIFQAEKFLTGTKTSFLAWKNITNAIMLDSMTGISEAATQFGDVFRTLIDDTVPSLNHLLCQGLSLTSLLEA